MPTNDREKEESKKQNNPIPKDPRLLVQAMQAYTEWSN
jgi:hypothetical protein